MRSSRAAKPKAVDEYLTRVPPEFRAALQHLRKAIRAAAPDAEEVISYGMPAFRQNGMIVYFAAFKDHCSLFVPSDRVRRQFSEELKPFKSSKGTYRFTPNRPIPADLVGRVVRARLAETARGSKPAGGVARSPRRPAESHPAK